MSLEADRAKTVYMISSGDLFLMSWWLALACMLLLSLEL